MKNEECTHRSTTVVIKRVYGGEYVTWWVVSRLMLLSHMPPTSGCATPGARQEKTKAERGVSRTFKLQAERNHHETKMYNENKTQKKRRLEVRAKLIIVAWYEHPDWPCCTSKNCAIVVQRVWCDTTVGQNRWQEREQRITK